ncbi:extracellular solute-binding protein [Spirochaeta isovalerica]|nr:extracellular solute-binding protein [Spirochaeta isovalerica]
MTALILFSTGGSFKVVFDAFPPEYLLYGGALMKRTLFTAFLLVILSAVLFASGADETKGAQGNGEPHVFSPDNPVTIDAWIVTSQTAPSPDNKISKLLKEKLGVTLNYDITTPDQQLDRIGIMLAAGSIPELVGSTDQQARLVQGGALLRLDDYLDSGRWPLLAEHVRPVRKKLTWTGGGVEDGLYQFPNYNRFYGNPPIMSPIHWGTAFWIQKDVLAFHNYPSLENMTLERYFDMIESYMKANPTIDGAKTIGFSFPMQGRVWGLTNPPLFLAGYPNDGGVMVDDGQAKIYANSKYAYDYFKFLNMAHDRGLVDPESFTQTLDQYLAKVASGRVLGVHDQRWSFGTANDALVANGQYERTYAATMPTFPGKKPYYADRDVLNINQGFGIASNAENPELLLDFLEIMLTPEWQTILSWGIEGEDYLVDENGLFYKTQEMRDNFNNLTWKQDNRLEALLDIMVKRQGELPGGNAFAAGDQPGEFFDSLKQYDKDFLAAYGLQTWRQFVNDPPPNPAHYPAWQISPPDGSAAQVANQQLEDAAQRYLSEAVLTDPARFDSVWDEYMAAIDSIDVAAFEAVITEGVQARIRAAGGE